MKTSTAQHPGATTPQLPASRPARRAWLALLVTLTLAACGETTPQPTEPTVTAFTATPANIEAGETSTLAWTVTGTAPTIVITDTADAVVHNTTTANGNHDVNPSVTTTYTLTATNAAGNDTATTTVTIVPSGDPASITILQALLALGSQVNLTWTAANATSFDVYGAASADPDAPADLIATLPGTARDALVAIPASDRQTIRVCARSTGGDTCATTGLTNVVTNAADYDPYFLELFDPEPEIPGTLRYLLERAEDGAVIGFASDITRVDLRGVALLQLEGLGWQDAHLILDRDVTISGPDAGVTLNGVSAFEPGDPGDPFTYRSRLVYVVEGATVQLDRLVLSGGTFIYNGGGIRNDGDLTVSASIIRDNRAWDKGGGIWNNASGRLMLVDSAVIDNQGFTTDEELADPTYAIRGGFEITMYDTGRGGGLFVEPGGEVTIVNSVIEGNLARDVGGGMVVAAEALAALTGSLVQGNVAADGGGGIHHLYLAGRIGDLQLTDVSFGSGNTPVDLLQVPVVGGSALDGSPTDAPRVPSR